MLARVGREVFDAHAVDSRRAPLDFTRSTPVACWPATVLLPSGLRARLAGWDHADPRLPRSGSTSSPSNHGSSLSLHVRPFAPCRRLLWPLLTSARSRREFLPVALCRIPVCRLFARLRLATRRSAWALMIQLRPFWNYGSARHRYARQISPGKNAMFPCASAAFTLSAVSDGLRHEVPTRPQTRPSMQFLSVASHLCAPASFRQALADCPCLRLVVTSIHDESMSVLPQGTFTPLLRAHAGRTPGVAAHRRRASLAGSLVAALLGGG